VTLAVVEEYGVDRLLADLRDDLLRGDYHPSPVRRVEIPKPDGRMRPPGIPICRPYCTSFQRGLGIARRKSGPSLGSVSFMRPNLGSRSDAWAYASRR
jgi:hypothetical protein